MDRKIAPLVYKPRLLLALLMKNIRIFRLINDRKFLEIVYRLRVGQKLNLDQPKLFNEKLQWLKLYDRKKIYIDLVDKVEVRNIIEKLIGPEYLIPIYGVYNSYEEINFDDLPNQFVLKASHTSGDVFVCKDKSKINFSKLEKILNKWLKRNYYWEHREWPYKNVKPKIICEKYLKQDKNMSSSLIDYKFYCFNGNPKYCQVIRNRNTFETMDFYDMEWNKTEFTRVRSYDNSLLHSNKTLPKPEKFEKMIEIAKKLSNGLSFIRVDLYYIDNRIYFGELTFYPVAGFGILYPYEWNSRLGNELKLPKKKD